MVCTAEVVPVAQAALVVRKAHLAPTALAEVKRTLVAPSHEPVAGLKTTWIQLLVNPQALALLPLPLHKKNSAVPQGGSETTTPLRLNADGHSRLLISRLTQEQVMEHPDLQRFNPLTSGSVLVRPLPVTPSVKVASLRKLSVSSVGGITDGIHRTHC